MDTKPYYFRLFITKDCKIQFDYFCHTIGELKVHFHSWYDKIFGSFKSDYLAAFSYLVQHGYYVSLTCIS